MRKFMIAIFLLLAASFAYGASPYQTFTAKDYAGYREGARFRKADLHTHTPASQCSGWRGSPLTC